MTKKELNEYLFKEPFEPFRINMADGKHFDVTNPRLAVAMDTRMFLAFPEGGWTLLALGHVTGLEVISSNGRGKGRAKGRRRS
jgi:hypothetical protein